MALYRCAACGSPHVVCETQKEGYNYIKGAIGTAVLGAGGAVAGINGKSKQVYKCADCGLTLDHPMDSSTKLLIDLGVDSELARESLQLAGQKIEWDFLKRKYKNIELGLPDQQNESAPQAAPAVVFIEKETPSESKVKTIYVDSNGGNTNALLKRVFMFLEDGDFDTANSYCERVLDMEPENARAYLGQLMAELKVSKREDLKKCKEPFDKSKSFQKAIRFGDEALIKELNGYIIFINERKKNEQVDCINKFYALDSKRFYLYDLDDLNYVNECCDKALKANIHDYKALYVKGRMLGWRLYTQKSTRLNDAILYFDKAIESSPQDMSEEIKHKAYIEIPQMAISIIEPYCDNFRMNPSSEMGKKIGSSLYMSSELKEKYADSLYPIGNYLLDTIRFVSEELFSKYQEKDIFEQPIYDAECTKTICCGRMAFTVAHLGYDKATIATWKIVLKMYHFLAQRAPNDEEKARITQHMMTAYRGTQKYDATYIDPELEALIQTKEQSSISVPKTTPTQTTQTTPTISSSCQEEITHQEAEKQKHIGSLIAGGSLLLHCIASICLSRGLSVLLCVYWIIELALAFCFILRKDNKLMSLCLGGMAVWYLLDVWPSLIDILPDLGPIALSNPLFVCYLIFPCIISFMLLLFHYFKPKNEKIWYVAVGAELIYLFSLLDASFTAGPIGWILPILDAIFVISAAKTLNIAEEKCIEENV